MSSSDASCMSEDLESPNAMVKLAVTRFAPNRFEKPIQIEGMTWMFERELDADYRGGICAYGKGLGKTVMTIGVFLGNPKTRSIVVVPDCLVGQWESEIKRFASSLNAFAFASDYAKRGYRVDGMMAQILEADVVLTSFEVLVRSAFKSPAGRVTNPCYDVAFDRMVVDEAHNLNRIDLQRYKCLSNVKVDGPRWALTASDITTRSRCFEILASFIGGRDVDAVREDAERLRELLVFRREKSDLTLRAQLPRVTIVISDVLLDASETRIYAHFSSLFAGSDRVTRGRVKKVLEAACVHPYLAYEAAKKHFAWPEGVPVPSESEPSSKFERVFEIVAKRPTKAENRKTLIFTSSAGETYMLDAFLQHRRVATIVVDSTLTTTSRHRRNESFATCSDERNPAVLLTPFKSSTCGFNLQAACRVVFIRPCDRAEDEDQAIGRAHRIGQTHTVTAHRLVSKLASQEETVDDVVLDRLLGDIARRSA